MKNAIIAQSGGPTAAINASLAGVISGALQSDRIEKVYGSLYGIEGILQEKILPITAENMTDDDLNILKQTPSSYLGSCRYKLPKDFSDTTIFDQIFSFFTRYNIGYFFYIGGNDSMDTVYRLNEYACHIGYDIHIMGVPKTIDNDLDVTDHTPGYGSAAKFIATSVKEIALDSNVYDLDSVTIIEIMGRNAGWLTAASALARTDGQCAPHLIYLPETTFCYDKFLSDIARVHKQHSNVVICVSEGIKTADGSYVCEGQSNGLTDVFGHKNLSGTAKVLEAYVREKLGYKARGIELNVLQRSAAHCLSKTDIDEAFAIGKSAVEAALKGESGRMMIYERMSDAPYTIRISSTDIQNAANAEKVIPASFIHAETSDITDDFFTYAQPLIMGEVHPIMKKGVPVHLVR